MYSVIKRFMCILILYKKENFTFSWADHERSFITLAVWFSLSVKALIWLKGHAGWSKAFLGHNKSKWHRLVSQTLLVSKTDSELTENMQHALYWWIWQPVKLQIFSQKSSDLPPIKSLGRSIPGLGVFDSSLLCWHSATLFEF